MSIAAMNWAWGQALPPTPKLVLMALADAAADDHGVCWPSAATLARKCSVSTRTVRRILQELVQRGLIDTEARFRKDGSRTANRYVMALRGGDKMSPGPVARNRAPTPGWLGPCDTRDTPRTTTRSVRESPPLPFSASVAPAIGTCP
ncbi:MAG: helix-turn-helix domain-containing protein [Gammaproteobacteria bacterium]